MESHASIMDEYAAALEGGNRRAGYRFLQKILPHNVSNVIVLMVPGAMWVLICLI